MSQKCTNPECDAEFRYSSRGRLFAFDLRHPEAPCRDVPRAVCEKQPSHATIYFWLCERCASKMTVRFTQETGVSVVDLRGSRRSRLAADRHEVAPLAPIVTDLRSA